MSPPAEAVQPPARALRWRHPTAWLRCLLWVLAALILLGLAGAWLYHRSTRSPASGYAEALNAVGENRLEDAQRAAIEYLRQRPRDTDARILLAKILAERKQYSEALLELRQIPKNSRWWPEAHRMQGESLWHLGYAERAEAIWLECIREHPEAAWPRWDLLRGYFLAERRAEAWQVAQQLYELKDASVGALLDLLTYQVEPPSVVSEARMWEQCLRVEPTSYYARRSLGGCYIDLNRGSEAQHLLESCARERPGDGTVWRSLLRGALQQGDVETAQRVMGELPGELAADARFMAYRGQICELGGQWQAAIACYRQTAEQTPRNRKLHYQLSLLYRRVGNDEMAQRHAEMAQKLHDAFTTLAHYHAYPRDPDKPQDAGLYRKVAETLDQFGRVRQARMWRELAESLEQPGSIGRVSPNLALNRGPNDRANPDAESELEGLY